MISETSEAEKKRERVHEITGKTRVFGILADPIYHVKTPQTMNAVFAAHGLDCVLVPFHVAPDALLVLVEGLRKMQNFGGFIATVPHKPSMLDLCDEVTDAARHIGAVNCVRREDDGRMVGTMLDGVGFVEAMRSRGADVSGMKVFLVGAGGAASAIAFGLADAGISHITIANRSAVRAAELASRLAATYPGLSISTDDQDIEHHDLIVNGSTLGMRSSDAEPVDFTRIHARHLVADAIMEPAMTPLLEAAQSKGATIFPGKPMLESQILLMAKHMGALPQD
uniref:shikimate dehydrogenase family protein n=1 Tax=uncultured Rhizobium sp. TaxID=155567 RepID=UPI0026103E25|nr:shikimate dehydrogenase [uncultured Rhizobium sp.]